MKVKGRSTRQGLTYRVTMKPKEKASYYARKKLGVNSLTANTPTSRMLGLYNPGLRKKAADLIRKNKSRIKKMSFSSITRMK